jgi:hypothetical protein
MAFMDTDGQARDDDRRADEEVHTQLDLTPIGSDRGTVRTQALHTTDRSL